MSEMMTGGCACGKVRYTAAVANDDAYLCHCRMCQKASGGVSIAFKNLPKEAVHWEREPDYFLGCATMGRTCQVIVARHAADGELAGVLCRATRTCFVNGRPEAVGYLGQLRVDRRFQGRWLSTRSIPILRRLHAGLAAADGEFAGHADEDFLHFADVAVAHPFAGEACFHAAAPPCAALENAPVFLHRITDGPSFTDAGRERLLAV